MGNRTLSHPGDPTVSIHLKLPLSLKIAVDELGKKTGKSTGELFREWATSQVGSYEIELVKIEQEELKAEFELKSIRAHKLELQAEVAKQQITNNTRDELVADALLRLKGSIRERNFESILKINIDTINKKLGSNREPVTTTELKELLGLKAGGL